MIRRFSSIRNVIFDLDGTLIDGYGPVTESLNAALVAHGRSPIEVEVVRPLVGMGLEWLLTNFFPPKELDRAVDLFRQHYAKVYLHGNFLLPGVQEVLERLHAAGQHLAVASNKPGERVRGICEHLGIATYLKVMVGAGDVPSLKPDPGMVLAVMDLLGARPADSLYIGDTGIDVQTARAAGIPVVCVLGGSASHQQLLAAGPDLILPSLASLPEALDID